ncbi:MAG: 3-keto-disaccharide hydrolase [Candidatus Cyclobacteriaceae bacterium M3_2C_046]
MVKFLVSRLVAMVFILFAIVSCTQQPEKEEWVPLFNGTNLDGWVMKFSGSELNENYLNTFRVEDSILKVSYENYDAFNNRYGHLFYEKPFSSYRLQLQYRFVGEKLADSPWWTENNSGVMIHSQAPETMPLIPNPMDENVDFLEHFPVSIECQLLGDAVTANACQIHSFIDINGEQAKERNINSNSPSYSPEEWVQLEIVVLADSIVHHIVEGDTVLTYTNLRQAKDGAPLKEGYIALQAESQPVEFKNIEILKLE